MEFTQVISLVGHDAFLSSIFLIVGMLLSCTTFVVHRDLVVMENLTIKVSRITLVIGTIMSAFYFSIALLSILMV